MVGIHAATACNVSVIGNYRTCVSPGTEVLTWVEAEGARNAERSDLSTMPLGEVCLGTVLDQLQTMFAAQLRQFPCRRGLSVQVDGDDSFGPRSKPPFDLLQVDQIVVIHIHKHRPRPRLADGLGSRYPARCSRDYLITRADSQHAQYDVDGICAVAARYAVLHTIGGGEVSLEVAHELATDECAALDHGPQRAVELVPMGVILCEQVYEWNTHLLFTIFSRDVRGCLHKCPSPAGRVSRRHQPQRRHRRQC